MPDFSESPGLGADTHELSPSGHFLHCKKGCKDGPWTHMEKASLTDQADPSGHGIATEFVGAKASQAAERSIQQRV